MTRPAARRHFPHPGWAWPRGGRALLLGAALRPDQDQALAALRQWLQHHDLDEIGFADQRLLAAIAERHGPRIADLPAFPRLKGLQRQLWTQSRIRIHAVMPVLQLLAAEGIDLMLLKGAARVALHPAAQRQRAHQDVDILVRPDQIQASARILSANNWQTARGDSALAALARAPATRAINFQQLPWGDIDLHRCAYHGGNYHPALDAALWDKAEPAHYFGLPVWVPEAAERLAMTLSHGAWSPEAHSDWLVDAADILANDKVDWAYFVEVAAKRRIAGQARIGLSFLHDDLGLPLPTEAQRFLSGRCNVPTLLIARAAADMPRWLRPLRGLCLALARARRDRSSRAHVPNLVLSRARAHSTELIAGDLTTAACVGSPTGVAPGTYLFRAELALMSPLVKRRIELELNSSFENLARFRVFAVPSSTGAICARISARIRVTEPAADFQLLLRPGKLLAPGAPPKDLAKYAPLPFQVMHHSLTSV